MKKNFLILGGYGNAGRAIAQLLLQETDLQLIVAGRDIEKAKTCADELNQKVNSHRVSAKCVDVANPDSLKQAFAQVDFVVVASSTAKYVENVAKAALAANIDYLDTQPSAIDKINTLESMRCEIEQMGCCFITDGGFHPGILSTLVRYAALDFERIERAYLGGLMQINWKALSFSEATVTEFVNEIIESQLLTFKNDQWIQCGYQKFDFGEIYGQRSCVPLFMEELRALPNMISSLKEVGFYIAGFNWFTDFLVTPMSFALAKLSKKTVKPMSKLFRWSVNTFSKPPYGIVLILNADGWKEEKYLTQQIKLSHEDAYLLTAVPAVACLLQYLDGSIQKPGLWYQANIVEPKRMISDIQRLGIRVEKRFCV